jgi:hypothetical protein
MFDTGPPIAVLALKSMKNMITDAEASRISFGPELLAEILYRQTYRRSELAVPEKALMFAVLADAVETYQRYAFSTSPRRRFLFREVEEWFWKKETDHLFSFPVMCEVLGFDPAFLRLVLLRWAETQEHEQSAPKKTQLHSVRSQARKPLRSGAKRVVVGRVF